MSARVLNYPGFKDRNPIATELKILGGLFLEDIVRDPLVEEEFLAETYCTSGALSQYALVSRDILRARYATIFEKESRVSAAPVADKKGLSKDLMPDIVAAGLSRRPILLVGDVGSGKSMFIRHFIKVDAKSELARAIVLYIDFGSQPAVVDELRPFVVSEIIRQLEEKHGIDVYERDFVRGVYFGRLKSFSRGVYGGLKEIDETAYRTKEIEFLGSLIEDPEEHLKASLNHAAKGQRRQIVLFLDNVDQRPPKFQEEVFLIAQAFAEHWPLTAFVALRPETFAKSRVSGSLSAYQPRVFTIDPPRIDLVIAKRIAFAKRQLERLGRLSWFPDGLTIQSGNLLSYLDMLLFAFDRQTEIIGFVDNMSGGNVRRALDFVSTFVGSGHVDSRKILNIMERQGSYNLPLHEFLRAVTYGDFEHYDPGKSPIINVFDVSAADGREHFLIPILVNYIERAGQVGGIDGYVERGLVLKRAQELGFHPNQTEVALDRSLEKLLLATPTGWDGGEPSRYRITTVGAYTIKKLVFLFSYVDAMIVDTPIMDSSVRSSLDNCQELAERLDRSLTFIRYLDSQWRLLKRVEDGGIGWNWLEGSQRLRTEIAGIRERSASK